MVVKPPFKPTTPWDNSRLVCKQPLTLTRQMPLRKWHVHQTQSFAHPINLDHK